MQPGPSSFTGHVHRVRGKRVSKISCVNRALNTSKKTKSKIHLAGEMAHFIFDIVLLLTFATFIEGTPRVRRLAGGADAEIEKFPYMAAVKYSNKLVCGGAIISPNKILTAANCFWCKGQPIEECVKFLSVQTGSADVSKGNTNRVKGVKIVDGFVGGKFANDIAIVTLESEIKFSATEKAVDLPDNDVIENVIATSSGWGVRSESSRPSNILGSIDEKIIPTNACSEILRRNNTNLAVDTNDFCALPADGNPKAGLCVGDSGNPLVVDGKVIGVSTWGIGCGRGFPDVFTNVYKYVDFIKSQL